MSSKKLAKATTAILTTLSLISGFTTTAQAATQGPESGEFKAWTKVLQNGTQLKFYAKYPQLGKKIQFMVQDAKGVYRQVAWMRLSQDDLNENGNYLNLQNDIYFIRTVDLKLGKNRVQVAVDGKVVWGPKVATVTEEDLLRYPTTEQAAANINSLTSTIAQTSVNFTLGPNVPSSFDGSVRGSIARAVNFFSGQIGTPEVKVIVFSEKDPDWAQQQLDALGGGLDLAAKIRATAKTSAGCNFAFTAARATASEVIFLCTPSTGANREDAHALPHEYVHAAIMRNIQTGLKVAAPCWINEGAPTFFGQAIGFSNQSGYSDYAKFSRYFISRLAANHAKGFDYVYNLAKSGNSSKIISDLIVPTEVIATSTNCDGNAGYFVGAVLSELLVADYGSEKFRDLLLLNWYQVADWRVEFENIYGFTPATFYKSAAPYLAQYITKTR